MRTQFIIVLPFLFSLLTFALFTEHINNNYITEHIDN